MPMLPSFSNRVNSFFTMIDVRIVFPALEILRQNKVRLLVSTYTLNSAEPSSHWPVSACRRLIKLLCCRV